MNNATPTNARIRLTGRQPASYRSRMIARTTVGMVAVVAALLSVGGAHAESITDEPPQTCTEDCATGMTRAYPREWSDRQTAVVGIVWRDRVRYPHQVLWLQTKQAGSLQWVTVARATAGQDGRALFVVPSTSGRPGESSWRVRYPGDQTTAFDDSAPFSIPPR